MKRRKLAVVAAISTICFFLVYQYAALSIDYKIDDRLIEINSELKTLSETYGLDFFVVYPSSTKPPELSDTIPPEVYDGVNKLNVEVVYFNNSPGEKMAAYYINRPPFSFGPSRYYLYKENDRLDEDIVPSLEDAIRQQDGPPYFLCQRAEMPHWFFCAASDP
ncbi:hypothetical protein ACFQH5_18880 [Halomonas salifodinae]|uniref:Uncharacterized protein n=1 Tax=Halomonas salifodinae TaxID=438745 RepID=A0ABW2F0R4_9GAMM